MKKMIVCFCAYYPDGRFKKFSFEDDTLMNADNFQAEKLHEIRDELNGSLLITRMIKVWDGKWIASSLYFAPILSLPNGNKIHCIESVL
jgi:hypothetical protein